MKIAILVDISSSMDILQKPSAVLSWALANAAVDLRNFAGRGQQIQSTMIHWGSQDPRVVVADGAQVPGIHEVPCTEGTNRMHDAINLIETQIPGFLDIPEDGAPENRLLVQFTDWELAMWSVPATIDAMRRVTAAGVNMLTISPVVLGGHFSRYNEVMQGCPIQRGKISHTVYRPDHPDAVWSEAAQMLR